MIIKGYSSNYPLLCDLEVIFSNDKDWITLKDGVGFSVTVNIKTLLNAVGIEKTNGEVIANSVPYIIADESADGYTQGLGRALSIIDKHIKECEA